MVDSSDEDDAALQAALAASLRDLTASSTSLSPKGPEFIDLTADSDSSPPTTARNAPVPESPDDDGDDDDDDDDDAELRAAIALSLQGEPSVLNPRHHLEEDIQPQHPVMAKNNANTFNLLGIDRKKLEEERLSRVAKKRKAEEASSAQPSKLQVKKDGQAPNDPSAGSSKESYDAALNTLPPAASSTFRFPQGAVRKTWALGRRRENDIKFQEKKAFQQDFADIPSVRLCFVPMEPHVLFLIDLPVVGGEPQTPTQFFNDLVSFLKASTVHDRVIARLSYYDFTATAKFAFVHTIGGSHMGTARSQTGHWDDGLKELTLRTSKTFPCQKWGVTVKKTDGAEWKNNFLVYFPSLKTVKDSLAGTMGAGTICFHSKWYNRSDFPRNAMRDNINRRKGLLMHSKILFVRPEDGKIIDDANKTAYRGWAYIGSANLSESAWGRLVLDRSTTQPKLNCKNWECGVIVPIADRGPSATEDRGNDVDRVFAGSVPVPMEFPAPEYGPDTKPWYFLEDD
ncbi:predicted protein [Uncinocarpus reesii 1704]|uniref:PLD phosphodiesterase domain-containing protein n=1 Tax=Uncinocarpus reesii (strain UAMH 1704) TaxID=336963 RepID=C4JP33_UNCRE|nr:uncharacterized protein UREG_03092 [Uncinocarpus reesii 1704]EEP78247.1 predicted protein [Uncinocarpus reesii 1704]